MQTALRNDIGFSFLRFLGLFGRALEVLILPACIINLLWVFCFHHYTGAEILFGECIQLFIALLIVVHIAHLFINWRSALFGLGRTFVYLLLSSFMYL
jgi:hypothetical protein